MSSIILPILTRKRRQLSSLARPSESYCTAVCDECGRKVDRALKSFLCICVALPPDLYSSHATPHLHTDNSHRHSHLLPTRHAVTLTTSPASAYTVRHLQLREQRSRILQRLHATAATNPHLEGGVAISRYLDLPHILEITFHPQESAKYSSLNLRSTCLQNTDT